MNCQACGMHTQDDDGPAVYHPYLFCELFRLGHHDPASYLQQALPTALMLLPSLASQNAADHFQIVKREP